MALADNHPMWRPPHHHLDSEHSHDHVHWVELFFDLIHVVTIFMLGNFLADQHDMPGFIAFVMMFMALWLAWGETSVYNSIYVSTDWKYRVTTAFQTLSVLFMAASIPAIEFSFTDPGKGFAYFAAAYGFNRLILGLMYYRAIHSGAESTSLAKEQAVRLFGLAILYFVAAALPAPYSLWLFIFGVIATQVFYFIPSMTVMRLPRFVPRMGHFTERFALLLLIVNGEGFFKLVVTLSEKGIYKVGFDTLVNVGIGGLAIFALTWIYYDFVGHSTGSRSDDKSRYVYAYWLGHMFLMMAAVMIGVALAGEVYVGFFEPYPTFYGTMGTLGLALYLFCILVIQWSIKERISHRFARPWILITGIALALFTYVIFPYTTSLVGNTFWAGAVAIQLIIPLITAHRVLLREDQEEQQKVQQNNEA